MPSTQDGGYYYLGYVPSIVPPTVFAILFGLVFLAHLAHWLRSRQMRFWLWMLCGLAGETGGYIARLLMHNAPASFGLFMTQIFCLVLSPVFFAGVNYILFSKLARYRLGKDSKMFRWTSYGFIASDILTFLIQATGGSFFSSQDYNMDVIGGKILLAGLVLQAASVICFCLWMFFMEYGFCREEFRMEDDYREEWGRIRVAQWVSITGIMIRAIYRIAEYAGGENGYLLEHEIFLYCLDSAPIFVATAIFAIPRFFPGGLLQLKVSGAQSSCFDVEMNHVEEKQK